MIMLSGQLKAEAEAEPHEGIKCGTFGEKLR
jgi:hypothetical protein